MENMEKDESIDFFYNETLNNISKYLEIPKELLITDPQPYLKLLKDLEKLEAEIFLNLTKDSFNAMGRDISIKEEK